MTGNQIHFTVEAPDRVVVTCFESWECRGECALEFMCDLVLNWPELLVGIKGGISFGDSPPSPEWASQFDLAFSSTKCVGETPCCLPIPCPYTFRWPQVGIPNAETMMEELLANDAPHEDPRMFWIGANTHPSRAKLCEIGRAHPGHFDTEIMQWDPGAPGGQRSKTRQVSIPEHAKYKYLIDCEGGGHRGGYSARIKWLLATGRPVFIVDRTYVEYWHENMQPWVHYVPVKADLSDLLENHARLEADPALYESIGRNARQFAAKNLTINALLEASAKALWNVRKFSDRNHPISIIAVYSNNSDALYENLLSSLNPQHNGFQLFTKRFDLSDYGEVGFQSESWYQMLAHQVEYAIEIMESKIADNEYFIISDVDIHFFQPEKVRLLLEKAASLGLEFHAALEHPDRPDYYNAGFIILRKCPNIVELYKRVLDGLQTRRLPFADQDEINQLLPELDIRHKAFPPETESLGSQPVYENTVLYHATKAKETDDKLNRIRIAKQQMENREFGTEQPY